MKIKSKIGDGFFIGLVVFTILTLAMYVYWVISTVWWPAITLTAILLIVIAPIYFATYYELTRTELRIYSGVLGKTIPYRSIISMTDADSIAPAFCLSSRRILIRYMEGDEIKTVYVSPANREQFRDLINAEISKSAAFYEDAPKTALDKAVAKARKQVLEPTAPELRAAKIAEIEENERNQAVVDKELKNLDNVINKNVSTVTFEKRKAAENKLLAKVRKLKSREDKKAKKSGESTVQSTTLPETDEQKKARLANEKAKLLSAIENAKKDQYVPPKRKAASQVKTAETVNLGAANDGEKVESGAKEQKAEKTPAKHAKTAENVDLSANKTGENEKTPVSPEVAGKTENNTTSPKSKAVEKKEKVAAAKKSKAVVKKIKKVNQR